MLVSLAKKPLRSHLYQSTTARFNMARVTYKDPHSFVLILALFPYGGVLGGSAFARFRCFR